jgi:superfamily I DNA and/or RNA helicase
MHEVRVIVNLAQNYVSKHRSFRIITPYDAQRAAIVKALKDSKIPCDDKCFNVDSFQGK